MSIKSNNNTSNNSSSSNNNNNSNNKQPTYDPTTASLPPPPFYHPNCFLFPPFVHQHPHNTFATNFNHPSLTVQHQQQLAQAVAAFQQRQQQLLNSSSHGSSSHGSNNNSNNNNNNNNNVPQFPQSPMMKNYNSEPPSPKNDEDDDDDDDDMAEDFSKKRRECLESPPFCYQDGDDYFRFRPQQQRYANSGHNNNNNNNSSSNHNNDNNDDDKYSLNNDAATNNDDNNSNDVDGLTLMDRRFMPSPLTTNDSATKQEFGSGSSSGGGKGSPQNGGGGSHHWTFEEQFKQLYEMSSEPKRKDFLDELFAFMQKRGTPVNRIPIMAKQTLDLYELFRLVVSKGGLVEVINKKLWREITKGLNLPSSITSAAFTLRTQYMKYLYPFECEKMKLSTLSELQSAIDGNRREGRRPGYGYDFSPIPTILHTPPNPHHPLSGTPLRPIMRPPTGFSGKGGYEDHPHLLPPTRHHLHLPLALRSFAEHDARAMEAATRAMEEASKRMEELNRSMNNPGGPNNNTNNNNNNNNLSHNNNNGMCLSKSVFLTPPELNPHNHTLPLSLSHQPPPPLFVGTPQHHLPLQLPHLPLPPQISLPQPLGKFESSSTPNGSGGLGSGGSGSTGGAAKRPMFMEEARFVQQLSMNHANIKMTSNGRLDGLGSMLVSIEINGITYQGVLFAQQPRRI